MMNNNIINFKRERDLGAIITDTFKFIRENWKPYFTFIVKIIGPILLVGAAFMVFAVISYSSAAKGMMVIDSAKPSAIFNFLPSVLGWGFLLMLVWGIVYILLSEVSLYYIKSYIKNNGVANFEEVKSDTYKNFWKFIGLGFLAIIMIVVGAFLCYLPAIYLLVVFFLASPIMVFENKSIGDTISHCFKLISNNWWNTFGITIVLSLLVGVLGSAFSIPALVYQLISTGIFAKSTDPTAVFDLFDDPIYLGLTFLSYFGKFIFYSITLISSAFIYFDLNEIKNFTGAIERIDNLGENTNSQE